MDLLLFLLFSALAVLGAVLMIFHRNAVTSALSLAVSFLAVAGLFILLDAELMGIFQILIYAGAIMVLFLFIIMLLDVKKDSHADFGPMSLGLSAVASLGFIATLGAVLFSFEPGKQPLPELDPQAALSARAEHPRALASTNALLEEGKVPDAHLLGEVLLGRYLLPMQIIATLLLVATIGVVLLCKKTSYPIGPDAPQKQERS